MKISNKLNQLLLCIILLNFGCNASYSTLIDNFEYLDYNENIDIPQNKLIDCREISFETYRDRTAELNNYYVLIDGYLFIGPFDGYSAIGRKPKFSENNPPFDFLILKEFESNFDQNKLSQLEGERVRVVGLFKDGKYPHIKNQYICGLVQVSELYKSEDNPTAPSESAPDTTPEKKEE